MVTSIHVHLYFPFHVYISYTILNIFIVHYLFDVSLITLKSSQYTYRNEVVLLVILVLVILVHSIVIVKYCDGVFGEELADIGLLFPFLFR